MKIRIYDVNLITPSQLFPHSAIDVEDGKIVAVYKKNLPEAEEGIQIIDGAGCYAAPGFVDLPKRSARAVLPTLCTALPPSCPPAPPQRSSGWPV